jgi:hypothetical protein
MLLSALVTLVWSQMLPQGQRVFHQLGVIILVSHHVFVKAFSNVFQVTASVAYFCLGIFGSSVLLGNADNLQLLLSVELLSPLSSLEPTVSLPVPPGQFG